MPAPGDSEDDVVIVAAYRTPNGKATRGSFKDLKNDELISIAIAGVVERTGIDPKIIEEVIVGHALSPMNGSIAARMGALRCGIPIETPVMTINRQCGSGLESISLIADKIKLNRIEVGLAGGFESMTSYGLPKEHELRRNNTDSQDVLDCLVSLGEVSEILAERYGITREMADEYAIESQGKALRAKEGNLFSGEMIPVSVNERMIVCDEGIRETSLEKIKDLKPVFRINGVSTAANASQLSDGASVVLLMKRKKAIDLNMPVMGVFIDFIAVGVRPRDMGIGPAIAIPKLLERNNLRKDQVSCFEINEAFASQMLCCIKELDIDMNKVNKYGGSIALGHPIGSSGGRIVCTLLNVMRNEGLRGYGVVSLCVGSGHGVAALIRR